MSALGCYASSVITAVTAQNTKQVFCVQSVEATVVESQLRAVLTDLRPNAIKIGMVGCAKNIETIAQVLAQYRTVPLVIDPVMVSTSGNKTYRRRRYRHLLPMPFAYGNYTNTQHSRSRDFSTMRNCNNI